MMNIKQAKTELKNTIRAYLSTDEQGLPRIDFVKQRPVLLMGPPGVGKTAVMEQLAAECDLALVSYTITHHTRQSAVGLPMIVKRNFGEVEYSATEYTMSEIIGSVYQAMERTGKKHGILFLDEINCVSETLAPTMLPFLQCKTFGTHTLPQGWIIVAAGNPPEYNKSVRELDVVTLDRVKRIDVREDLGVWKEYASRRGIYGAILAYLDSKPQNFYKMESTPGGKEFVTPRGWEDLSQLLYSYDALGFTAEQPTVEQYLQHPAVAKDFAAFLALWRRYNRDVDLAAILEGTFLESTVRRCAAAGFDEKLALVGLLGDRLTQRFADCYRLDQTADRLFALLKRFKELVFLPGANPMEQFSALLKSQQEKEKAQRTQSVDKVEKQIQALLTGELEKDGEALLSLPEPTPQSVFDTVKQGLEALVERRKQEVEQTSAQLDFAFDFLEAAFGRGQELVWFVTQLAGGYYSSWFIAQFGCVRFDQYNESLLFEKRRSQLLDQVDRLEQS